jgi:hypothetical protein
MALQAQASSFNWRPGLAMPLGLGRYASLAKAVWTSYKILLEVQEAKGCNPSALQGIDCQQQKSTISNKTATAP